MVSALLVVTGCSEGQMPGFLKPKGDGQQVSRAASAPGGALATERDVEAPEIFSAKEAGLWDGRPSLGGVWVAHPDVEEPERTIIRNTANGKFVIGALFRKERSSPGPRIQVSSDAAAAIGMLAGAPANLDVVALRREEMKAPEDAQADPLAMAAGGALPSAPDVTEGALDPVLDSASRALDTASSTADDSIMPVQTAALEPASAAVAQPAAAPKPPAASKLARPYLQIGIFSVEENANNTATAMRQAGMLPTVKPGTMKSKPFWRVVVGPAQTEAERAQLLKTIKSSGFEDAYAVSD
ncbi:SPOR domain-containing protein [Sagittula stellata]|uniref:Lipoprotein, putative n=1 Tax=Sagittula stellata (strain ATCC 700073 / DSM 11524 / E-37) TaxID=388399 RepID=A3K0R8_SAGS3|nr:SPOR domain-containing protein [Sagittula stellata]EBA09383.1 lipoprotein, putative [Sagittula stellata E-37]